MRKFIFIPGFLFFCTAALQAQQKNYDDTTSVITETVEDNGQFTEEKVNDTIYIDTTLYYNQLETSPDSVKSWKNQQAFAYLKNLDSLLKDQQKKPQKKQKAQEEDYTPSSGPNWFTNLLSSGIFRIFIWTIAAIFVLFILYKLFLTEGAFRKNTKSAKSTEPEAEEEIINSESDFAILIRQAIQAGNYRLAVRYQYLQTLHKLADKNLISLAGDKTNYQYVREITNENYRNDFAALTLNYEYVWYGEFAIEENIYRRLETGFSQFNNKI